MSDCQKLCGEDQARPGTVFSPKVKPGSFLVWCLALSHFAEWVPAQKLYDHLAVLTLFLSAVLLLPRNTVNQIIQRVLLLKA